MTDPAPEFFVPGVPRNEAEPRLAALAHFAGEAVPPIDRRPYRITWDYEWQRWTAEVGRPLRGVRIAGTPKGRPGQPLRDSGTVLAIFPSGGWKVVTDAPPVGRGSSWWSNPFVAGIPLEVDYFYTPFRLR